MKRLIILDGIQDPGNLGTLLRTALGLGWDGAFLLKNTCDPFNQKAIRAARGACFRLPLYTEGSLDDLQELLRDHDFTVSSSTLADEIRDVPIALWLGSEGKGLSGGQWSEAQNGCEDGQALLAAPLKTVKIDMAPEMESLNVAVAGGGGLENNEKR
eukprot:jgi/Bigna1/128003/aug1.5_g2711